jgi:hypothetical protein
MAESEINKKIKVIEEPKSPQGETLVKYEVTRRSRVLVGVDWAANRLNELKEVRDRKQVEMDDINDEITTLEEVLRRTTAAKEEKAAERETIASEAGDLEAVEVKPKKKHGRNTKTKN